MELYKVDEQRQLPSLNIMMLGCDIATQETYLAMLSDTPIIESQTQHTDFLIKKVVNDVEDTMVKIYSNPFGSITDVPQSTFKKAQGFLLIYNTIEPESVSCLEEYLYYITEY